MTFFTGLRHSRSLAGGRLHSVNLGNVADVSEIQCVSIFRVEDIRHKPSKRDETDIHIV
jgi:hypothetical protein